MVMLGLKELSSEPSGFNLAILFRVLPPMEVNAPPTIIFPSVCMEKLWTAPFAFGLKLESKDPSALSLPM